MNYMQFLVTAAGANQALDDMETVSGIRLGGGRYPVAAMATALAVGDNVNNITLNNSQVGIINIGTVNRINSAITLTRGSDAEEVGKAIEAMANGILASRALDAKQQSDLIDLLDGIATQVVGPRKPSVMSAFTSSIVAGVHHLSELAALAETLRSLVEALPMSL